jgi:hypothetical protein
MDESYVGLSLALKDFLARGLHSAQEARRDNQYVSAADVVAKLEKKLAAAREKGKLHSQHPGCMDAGSSPA